MKKLFKEFNNTVKEERFKYFSNCIAANVHNPKFLFKTINTLIHHPTDPMKSSLLRDLNHFCPFSSIKFEALEIKSCHLCLFYHTVKYIRFFLIHFIWCQYQLDLLKVITGMKSLFYPSDVFTHKIFKRGFCLLSSDILAIFNKSSSLGVTLPFSKSAVVQPLLRKSTLTQIVLIIFDLYQNHSFLHK